MSFEKNGNSDNYSKEIKKLQRKINRLRWFPAYQSFSEIGLHGSRNDSDRYKYLDFSKCKGKTVIDFGCNLGQTCTKAYYAGAKKIIGLDCQKKVIKYAKKISVILGTNIDFYVIDFNDPQYKDKILEITKNNGIDISFFLSVYRTKELKNRDDLFKFIIEITNDIIFFEGHASPRIDTKEYYEDVFKKFNIDYNFLGYTQDTTRPFFEVYPKHNKNNKIFSI